MRLLLLVALTCACSRGGFDGDDPDEDWWGSQRSRRVPLTFDNTPSQEDLLDFPVLLRLNSSRLDFSASAAGGADLRLVDGRSGLELPYEIEHWTTGDALVWVRVPEIPAGVISPELVFIYYGGPTVPGEDTTAVWAGDYRRVYHFNDTLIDSTTAVVNATGDAYGPGLIGSAGSFDGSQWVNLGNDLGVIRGLPAVTFSAWAHPRSFDSDEPHLVACSKSGSPNRSSRVALVTSISGALGAYVRAPDAEDAKVLIADQEITTDTWSFLATVADVENDIIRLFVDGVEIDQSSPGFGQTSFDDTNSASCAIGAEDDGTGDFWNGSIDEARIIAGRRTADWLAAENRNVRGEGLVSFGAEQVRP